MQSGRPLGGWVVGDLSQFAQSKQNTAKEEQMLPDSVSRMRLRGERLRHFFLAPSFASFSGLEGRQEAVQFRGIMLSIHLNTLS